MPLDPGGYTGLLYQLHLSQPLTVSGIGHVKGTALSLTWRHLSVMAKLRAKRLLQSSGAASAMTKPAMSYTAGL